jgi:peptidoglycan/xylan/chitin deacetylase (PgdA/CDA1 family)
VTFAPATVPQIPVLNYHHVHDGPDDFFRTRPDLFRRQMDVLRSEGFTAIGPDQLLAIAGTVPDRRYVMVTFDDGYVDFKEHAWPILKALSIPTTVFVISRHVGGWNDWDGLRRAPHRHLDAEALRELRHDGVVIGSHSCTHRPLFTTWGAALQRELRESRHDLEALTGAPVSTFAYPGGSEGWHVRRATRRVYDLAFATDSDHSRATSDRYRIARFDPCFSGNLDVFRRRLDEHCGFGRHAAR